jgi:hypothetical protein
VVTLATASGLSRQQGQSAVAESGAGDLGAAWQLIIWEVRCYSSGKQRKIPRIANITGPCQEVEVRIANDRMMQRADSSYRQVAWSVFAPSLDIVSSISLSSTYGC